MLRFILLDTAKKLGKSEKILALHLCLDGLKPDGPMDSAGSGKVCQSSAVTVSHRPTDSKWNNNMQAFQYIW